MLRVRVRAPVKPTEDPERVRRAILNLFPDATVDVAERDVWAEGGTLDKLAELVRNHQIPDSARRAMLAGRVGAAASFTLGKQAAYVGKPSFGGAESPLGAVRVTVEADDEAELLRAIYAAAPDTTVEDEALATVPPEQRPAGE